MRAHRSLLVLLLILSGAVVVSPYIGSTPMPLDILWNSSHTVSYSVFWELRIPRMLLGVLAGGALGMAGLAFQMLFRNPLATPYTLGISNGAALGVSFALLTFGAGNRTAASLVGAGCALALVLFIARLAGRIGQTTILLAGVVLSFFFGSVTVLLQYLSNESQLMRMTRWLMGSIETPPEGVLLPLAIAACGAFLLNWGRARELLLLSFGEEFAISRGVHPQRETLLLFAVNSVLIGVVVSVTGPIGFIGIIAPYLVRAWFGMQPRMLVVGSFILGGSLLTLCDTIGRAVAAPFELPAGVITALIGAPIFIVVLIRAPAKLQGHLGS